MNQPYIGCGPSPYFNPAAAGLPIPYGAQGFAANPGYPPIYAPFSAGTSIIGADVPAAEASMTDKAKAWLNEPSFGVKNGYLLAGAVATAGIWYAYHEGVFGR